MLPGLEDLSTGRLTEAALLVECAASHLRELGMKVPESPLELPEHALFHLLSATHGDEAHA